MLGAQTERRHPMNAALCLLPKVWATASEVKRVAPAPLEPNLAFYRKYTEGLLRRYVTLSMESGRVPSLLGQEMFRGRVTRYRVHSFEDVVIFVHDVGKCLEMLGEAERLLISRIALQGHTQSDAAELMGLPPRTVIRRYGNAVDGLTRLFLDAKLLMLPIFCQEGEPN
jgi:hypothetical protein